MNCARCGHAWHTGHGENGIEEVRVVVSFTIAELIKLVEVAPDGELTDRLYGALGLVSSAKVKR